MFLKFEEVFGRLRLSGEWICYESLKQIFRGMIPSQYISWVTLADNFTCNAKQIKNVHAKLRVVARLLLLSRIKER